MPHRSLVMAMAALVCLLAVRIAAGGQPQPETFADISDHFSYGSVGTEERAGLPYWIWRVLPIVFADKLPNRPGTGYERLGFINGGAAHGRPIGTSFLAGPRRAGRAQLRDLSCRHDPDRARRPPARRARDAREPDGSPGLRPLPDRLCQRSPLHGRRR